MPSGERMNFGGGEAVDNNAEINREVAEARGEVTNKVEMENRAREEAEAKAKLEAEALAPSPEQDKAALIAALKAEKARNEARIAELTPVPTSTPETVPLSSVAEANKETAKGKDGFKKFVALGLAAGTLLGGIAGAAIASGVNDQAPAVDTGKQVETNVEAEKVGIKDGYGEKGMYMSDNKPSELAFGSAVEVADIFDGDECEMIKYAADNEVEAMASYIAHLPKELQPDGFQGLSIKEAEDKLESLSDEDYEKVQAQFNEVIDQGFTRNVKLNGSYDNVYIGKKDDSGAVKHGNMEAVKSITNENGTARQLYWQDENGNELGSMTVKILVDDEGHIIGGCMQPLVEQGSNPIYDGLTTRQDTPTPGKVGNPTPTPGKGGDPTPDKTSTPDTPTPDTPTPDTPTPDKPSTPEDPTPDKPSTPEDPTPETPKPKDAENLKRIDKNIQKDIAKDVGTKEVKVTPTPTQEVEKQTPTQKPSSESYQGTEAKTQQNEASKKAEPVQQQVSKENNYNENKGGANAKEYAPVKEDKPAQQQADKQEVKKSEAPKTVEEAQDTLKDLGIE